MKEVLLIGAGGHCHSCIEVLESGGEYRIRGIVGRQHEVGQSAFGYEVLGSDEDLPQLIEQCPNAIIAVGQIKSATARVELYHRLVQLGAHLPTVTASTAVISRNAKLGPGTLVMHGAIINAGAVIGTNSIINSRALVEHDVNVGDHCHISTGAILNGNVSVGNSTFVGSGAVVFQCTQIGNSAVIGAGTIVNCAVEDNVMLQPRCTCDSVKNSAS